MRPNGHLTIEEQRLGRRRLNLSREHRERGDCEHL